MAFPGFPTFPALICNPSYLTWPRYLPVILSQSPYPSAPQRPPVPPGAGRGSHQSDVTSSQVQCVPLLQGPKVFNVQASLIQAMSILIQ